MTNPPLFHRFTIDQEHAVSGHKKRGRVIYSPNGPMRELQNVFKLSLERFVTVDMPYAAGGLPGNSPIRNVAKHKDNRYFFLTDIASAFDSVDPDKLVDVLVEGGYGEDSRGWLGEFILKYCISQEGGLVPGSPSSQLLFNIYCAPLDTAVAGIIEAEGGTYTRYVDDLTFSKPDNDFPTRDKITKPTRQKIRQAIANYGFELSYDKERILDIDDDPVIITGIQLNPNGTLHLPTRSARQIPGIVQERCDNEATVERMLAVIAGYKGSLYATMFHNPTGAHHKASISAYSKLQLLKRTLTDQQS